MVLLMFAFATAVLLLAQRPAPLPVGKSDCEDLAAIETRANELAKSRDYRLMMKETSANRDAILGLIAGDKLTTPHDFLLASKYYDDPSGWYEVRRAQQEYAMMALALGDPQAPQELRRTWDFMMISLGQRPRFGFIRESPEWPLAEHMKSVPPPAVLARVFEDPAAASAAAKKVADNPEIRALREADQAIRSGTALDFGKIRDAAARDRERRTKVMALLEQGVPKTGSDFEGLSLVMQHGETFADYRLACELSMASLIVGYDDPWLLTATYDRMLLALGHRQRFGTQFNDQGLRPLDPLGINDRMRLQFRLPPLADLKAREKEVMKKNFGG